MNDCGKGFFRVRSRIEIRLMIWNSSMMLKGLIREALQKMINYWNRFFDVAEEMGIDFCLYISPLESVM